MLRILYCFISAVVGAITGAVLFGAYLAVFFRVYSLFLGPFPLFEIAFLGTAYVENPYTEGFIVGGIIGIPVGLLAGLAIGFFQPKSFQKAVLTSAASTAFFFLILGFLLDMPSLGQLIFDPDLLTRQVPGVVSISLSFLIPSAVNGAVIQVINRATAGLLRLNRPTT